MLWLFVIIGSTIGSYIPSIFIKDAGFLSAWGIIGSLIGAIIGVWLWRKFDY